ncbi:DUF3192 domain-containing protein [Pleionea litopenaei]|uniref:DUF3192 domain-containing protein n=1 Tax=Pleionea litopenaei TaxID=3070815 RepID=A0AA51X6C9_9GAMM|nr:DUF3192 domain-containing protein [Pleionea sp. HL-JVS1]WMS85960.1 DUF3192 domain-containing protein [Pleionea sp. HL-JVS1]
MNKLSKSIAVNSLRWLSISVAAVTMSGCVIAIHDGEIETKSGWEIKQQENVALLSQLSIGSSINDVTEIMGGADDTEGFEKDGKTYIVLYYRTRRVHEDGQTTRDETTPVVFEDGKLIGWGEQLLAKYHP